MAAQTYVYVCVCLSVFVSGEPFFYGFSPNH